VKAAADQAQGLPPLVLRVYNVDTVAEHLGAFEQAVLLALVRPQTPLGREGYGRAILKEVQHRLERDVSAGAVYATLDRLEQKGLISSRLAPGGAVRGGRPRRHYSVQPTGLRALNQAKAAADRLWSGVRLPLKGMV
jgi:PadR family transcriptional regulator PadR